MLYMLCVLFAMFFAMFNVVKLILKPNNTENLNFKQDTFLAVFTLSFTFMIVLPFYGTMMLDAPTDRTSLILQWTGFSGALLILIVHGWVFLKRRKASSCAISLCAALLAFMYLNSLLFVSSDKSGLLNFEYLNSIVEIPSVQCDAGMLVVKLADKGEPTEWRCPKNFVLMGDTSKPFVPWTSYTKGESLELTTAIHTMIDSAAKGPKGND